jgi:hypothetical protein
VEPCETSDLYRLKSGTNRVLGNVHKLDYRKENPHEHYEYQPNFRQSEQSEWGESRS